MYIETIHTYGQTHTHRQTDRHTHTHTYLVKSKGSTLSSIVLVSVHMQHLLATDRQQATKNTLLQNRNKHGIIM